MELKVLDYIKKHNMIKKGDNVIIGISGGSDSVALLHFFVSKKQQLDINIYAAHINHMLRGDESIRDMQFVKSYCEKLGVELFLLETDVKQLAKDQKIGIEECGRNVRYNYFEQLAKTLDNSKIVTAHNMDDNLETTLLNIIRGTTLNGLCGIKPVRENIIRPFLNTKKSEIIDYCKQNTLDFVDDSSNKSDEYTRNKIRNRVVPLINEIAPNYLNSFERMNESINEDNKFLDLIATEVLNKAKIDNNLDINILKEQNLCILKRVVSQFYFQNEISFDNALINKTAEFISEGRGKLNIKKNIFVSIKNNNLIIEQQQRKTPYFEYDINNQTDEIKINILDINKFSIINKKGLLCAVDYDKIIGTAKFRQKKDGDFFRDSKRNCTKNLKKLFNEKKLDYQQRQEITVGADEMGIFWVEGFGYDQRVLINENTKKILVFEKEGI